MVTPGTPDAHACCCDVAHLTSREAEVLCVLASGSTSEEAARTLRVSKRTVDGHVAAMLRKAKARNRAGLLAIAVAHRIIDIRTGTPRWTGRTCLPATPFPGAPATELPRAVPAAGKPPAGRGRATRADARH